MGGVFSLHTWIIGGDTGLLLFPVASWRLEDRDTGEARLEPGAGPGPRARPERGERSLLYLWLVTNDDYSDDVTEVVSSWAGA